MAPCSATPGPEDPRAVWSPEGVPLMIVGVDTLRPEACRMMAVMDLRTLWPTLRDELERLSWPTAEEARKSASELQQGTEIWFDGIHEREKKFVPVGSRAPPEALADVSGLLVSQLGRLLFALPAVRSCRLFTPAGLPLRLSPAVAPLAQHHSQDARRARPAAVRKVRPLGIGRAERPPGLHGSHPGDGRVSARWLQGRRPPRHAIPSGDAPRPRDRQEASNSGRHDPRRPRARQVVGPLASKPLWPTSFLTLRSAPTALTTRRRAISGTIGEFELD
jgi:hypothetical protein